WMNTPTGLTMSGGQIVRIDPIAGALNPSTLQQALHMLLAAYAATGLAVAGAPAAILQQLSGDLSARTVALWQPIKLAALEGQFDTERGAPLRIGGWPDVAAEHTRYAIEIPRGLSLLAFHDPDAEVRGQHRRPDVAVE